MDTSSKGEIKSFLFMIVSAVLLGFVLLFSIMAFYSGKNDTLRQLLLAPSYVETLTFSAFDPTHEKNVDFAFNRFEWVFQEGGVWKSKKGTLKDYETLYDLLGDDKQVKESSEKLFASGNPTTFSLVVSMQGTNQERVYLELSFLPGESLYRVKTFGFENGASFTFLHEGVYSKIEPLFR